MAADLPRSQRYSRAARWFHWTAFAAVALAYLFVNLRGYFPRGSDAGRSAMQAHYLFGLVVLALVLPRLLHRFGNPPPPVVPALARWESALSRLTHGALYAFPMLQPLLGLLPAWARGPVQLPYVGLQLPSPMAPNHDLHESLGHLHGTIGEVFYYVIGVHIAAALWHHFLRGDNTLRRML